MPNSESCCHVFLGAAAAGGKNAPHLAVSAPLWLCLASASTQFSFLLCQPESGWDDMLHLESTLGHFCLKHGKSRAVSAKSCKMICESRCDECRFRRTLAETNFVELNKSSNGLETENHVMCNQCEKKHFTCSWSDGTYEKHLVTGEIIEAQHVHRT